MTIPTNRHFPVRILLGWGFRQDMPPRHSSPAKGCRNLQGQEPQGRSLRFDNGENVFFSTKYGDMNDMIFSSWCNVSMIQTSTKHGHFNEFYELVAGDFCDLAWNMEDMEP